MSDAPAFDLLGDLPRGSTVLEASAGTGKTYNVAGLVARYVAEAGLPLDALMVVTFSRSATRELRHRVRDRLRDTVRFLSGHEMRPAADPLLDHLAARDVRLRLARLQQALHSFDTATITTIHGLATDLLTILGTRLVGTLVEDQRSLRAGIAADARFRVVAQGADAGLLPWDGAAREIVATALTRPKALLSPEADPHGGRGAVAAAIAEDARTLHDLRLGRERLFGYDDLLAAVERVLTRDSRAAAYLAHLRQRFRVGLVDEFQDTDPVQWSILRLLFAEDAAEVAEGHPRSLVLVGDPKQAIYAFRGGDVVAYVNAKAQTGQQQTLRTNHRSDDAVVRACNAIFAGTDFGPGITAHDIDPQHARRAEGLGDAGVHLRIVHPSASGTRGGGKDVQRATLAQDTAEAAVSLLSDPGIRVQDPDRQQISPLRPDHVAVLVRTNAEAVLVQQALGARKVPAVLNGVGNVFATDAATHWLHLLRALERPTASGRVRIAGLTPLIGVPMADLLDREGPAMDRLASAMHRWAHHLAEEGVAATYRRIVADTGAYHRLLDRDRGGARHLADLEHLAELLHEAATQRGMGAAALLGWLERHIADAQPVPSAAHARRLEGTPDAVQIMTVHGAKGLQFPVVLCPYLWGTIPKTSAAMPYHDARTREQILLVDRRDPAREQYKQEQEQEERRLAYVAITRAMHLAVVWWPWGEAAPQGALGAILFPDRAAPDEPAAVSAALARHPATTAGRMHLVDVTDVPPLTWFPVTPADVADGPTLARLSRGIDQRWRRASYSSLTSAAHQGVDDAGEHVEDERGPGGDAAEASVEDQPVAWAPPRAVGDGADDAQGAVVLLADMPGGAEVGTAVHTVMEHADYTHPDLQAHLHEQLARAATRHMVDLGDLDLAAAGLAQAIRTPLGGTLGERCLGDVPLRDRRDEIDFELPVAGGERPWGRTVLLAGVADVLEAHLADDDPLAAYPGHLRQTLGDVATVGYLGGRIDLLMRTPEGGYLVADHKTNRLAPAGVALRQGHYDDISMAAVMIDNHYALQALLYLVAVHRMLRWRLPGYDLDRHLLGARYLFLRGMTGPDVPRHGPVGMPGGVFVWRPASAAILAVDRLLAAGQEAR